MTRKNKPHSPQNTSQQCCFEQPKGPGYGGKVTAPQPSQKGSQDFSTGWGVFSKAASSGAAVMFRIGTMVHREVTAGATLLGTVCFLCPEYQGSHNAQSHWCKSRASPLTVVTKSMVCSCQWIWIWLIFCGVEGEMACPPRDICKFQGPLPTSLPSHSCMCSPPKVQGEGHLLQYQP